MPHALVVNSGTAALHAYVVAAGIEPGDEVVTPAYSFWATSQAVLAHNGIPVFVDIDPETMNMDPAGIEEKIMDHTKVLLPVHVHALCAAMDPINDIARRPRPEGHRGCRTGDRGLMQGQIGDRHILIHFSHMSGSKYVIGDYDTDRDKLVVTDGGAFCFGPWAVDWRVFGYWRMHIE